MTFIDKCEQHAEFILGKSLWASLIALAFMMLLTTADVIGRYIFSHPIKGVAEIQELAMIVVVFFAAGYGTIRGRQISAEIIIQRVSGRTQAVLNSINYLFCAAIYGLMAWNIAVWGWANAVSPSGRASLSLYIPEAPFILAAATGCFLVCLASLVKGFLYMAQATGKQEEE